jgi:hypothetical protein
MQNESSLIIRQETDSIHFSDEFSKMMKSFYNKSGASIFIRNLDRENCTSILEAKLRVGVAQIQPLEGDI